MYCSMSTLSSAFYSEARGDADAITIEKAEMILFIKHIGFDPRDWELR